MSDFGNRAFLLCSAIMIVDGPTRDEVAFANRLIAEARTAVPAQYWSVSANSLGLAETEVANAAAKRATGVARKMLNML